MDLKDILYVYTIVENGSISSAASKLFITQPALSQALQRIEKELGEPLFERTSTKLVPTPLTHFVIQKGTPLLKSFDNFQSALRDYQNKQEKKITFGISQFYGRHYLTTILMIIEKIYPAYKVEVTEGESHFLEEELLKGHLDLAFYPIPTLHKSLETFPVHEEEIMLAIPNSDTEALSALGSPNVLSILSNKSFILMQQGFKLREITDEFFKDANVTPHVALESQNLDTCLSLVSHDYGLSFLPDLLQEEGKVKEVTFFSLENSKKYRHLALVCTTQKAEHLKVSKMAAALKEKLR